jgi:DNA-binding transcriptional MerR regulator
MNKEKQILNYMQNLGISREEAEQLYKDEEEDNLPELTPDQKKVEKEMRQADRKKETTPRKRERKPDEDKRLIIDFLNSNLIDFCHDFDENCIDDDVVIANPERKIEFTFRGNRYRLVLMKPRKEK